MERLELYWKMKESYPLFYQRAIPTLRGFMSEKRLDDTEKVLLEKVGPEASILELGSGDNALQKKLRAHGHRGLYDTMDVNRQYPHEFHALAEITKAYDFIFMFNLIEHLTLDEFFQYVEFAEQHLTSDGTLVLVTPNANHLNQVWKSDITHVKPYPLRDLFGIFHARGYAVAMYRILVVEEHYGILRWIRRRLAQLLAWILYAEIQEDVMVFAKRSAFR